jgi:hypothetical protein
MCTKNIPWGVKAASVYGCQSYHLYMQTFLKSVSLKLETLRPVQGCKGIALPFTYVFMILRLNTILSCVLWYTELLITVTQYVQFSISCYALMQSSGVLEFFMICFYFFR